MLDQHVPLSWATRQAAGAVAGGVDLDHLFERALISRRYGDDRDRISPLQLTLFQALLVEATEDSTHGLLSRRLDPKTGPIGFRILFGSRNLEDGLKALAQFYDMASRTIRFQLTTEGSQAFFAAHVADDGPGACIQEDIQLVYFYLGLCCFLQAPFPASWVVTRDPEHFNLGARHYAMDCPVRYGAKAGIAFPKALLARRPTAVQIGEYFWQPLEAALGMMAPARPADLLTGEVNNHELQVGSMAAKLDIAPSTYRRRMAQNGPGFRQFRERILLNATLSLLKSEAWCVEAIAAELGYSDARSLRRFVKRATGRTPSELREEFRDQAPPARLYDRLRETLTSLQN